MKSLFSIFLLLITTHVFSQEILVVNKNTGEPVFGVAVFNFSKSKSAITNLDGEVNLDDFGNSELIFFQHISYRLFSTSKSDILNQGNKVYLISSRQSLGEIVVSASKFFSELRIFSAGMDRSMDSPYSLLLTCRRGDYGFVCQSIPLPPGNTANIQ